MIAKQEQLKTQQENVARANAALRRARVGRSAAASGFISTKLFLLTVYNMPCDKRDQKESVAGPLKKIKLK